MKQIALAIAIGIVGLSVGILANKDISYSSQTFALDTASSTDTQAITTETDTSQTVTHIPTPKNVKAIYMSSWVAGTPTFREKLVHIIDTTEINTVVIDVKDNTGVISWDGRVSDIEAFVQELHSKNIYVIARVASFQDPAYAKRFPELAIQKITGGVWKDGHGIPWIDTGSQQMWDYIISIGKEAYAKGFDEVNLDYIRFPTDVVSKEVTFPVSGEKGKTNRKEIVTDFFAYVTSVFHKDGIPVSADVFGTLALNDLDIPTLGQNLDAAFTYFDFVSPMVYPSHFASGVGGFQNPAEHPREIITMSMKGTVLAADKVASSTAQSTSTMRAKIRPWYQDFNTGAVYTAEMVRAQIEAGDALGVTSWLLWDSANKYTPSALKNE